MQSVFFLFFRFVCFRTGTSAATVDFVRAFVANYDFTVFIPTDRMGGHIFNILNFRVDNAPLKGIHRLQHNISAIFLCFCSCPPCQSAQGFLSLAAVIFNIYDNLYEILGGSAALPVISIRG